MRQWRWGQWWWWRCGAGSGGMIYNVDMVDVQVTDVPLHNEYSMLLGYSAKFFVGLLLPKHALCHQKFALTINNLFFIGHPVCTDDNVLSSTKFNLPAAQKGNGLSLALMPLLPLLPPPTLPLLWLQTFHVAFVHKVPNLLSQSSGNISRYFDVIYQQVTCMLMVVLFQEQVLSNFVKKECDVLSTLKDEFTLKHACVLLVVSRFGRLHRAHPRFFVSLPSARLYKEYMDKALLVILSLVVDQWNTCRESAPMRGRSSIL